MAMTKEERAAYNKEYYKANAEKIKNYRKANAEKNKEYYKEYDKANAEKRKEYNKANAEKVKARQKAYHKANAEKVKAQQKKYRKANAEMVKARDKAYRKANPDKYNTRDARRRARKQAALHPQRSDSLIAQLYSLSSRLTKCTGIIYHVDHIIPLACGGCHHEDNLQVIPATLNFQKQDNPFFLAPTLKTYRDVPISLWSTEFKTILSKYYRELLCKYNNDTVRCRD